MVFPLQSVNPKVFNPVAGPKDGKPGIAEYPIIPWFSHIPHVDTPVAGRQSGPQVIVTILLETLGAVAVTVSFLNEVPEVRDHPEERPRSKNSKEPIPVAPLGDSFGYLVAAINA